MRAAGAVAALAAAVVVALAAAGCLRSPPPPPVATSAEPGAYYLAPHPGGPLRLLGPPGAAVLVWGPGDEPLATLTASVSAPGADASPAGAAGGAPGDAAVIDAPRGDLVLRVEGADQVWLDPPPARWTRLGLALHRTVLVDTGPPPLGFGSPTGQGNVTFPRPPVALRLLATGGYEGLDARVLDGEAVLLEAHASAPGPPPGSPGRLEEVASSTAPAGAALAWEVSARRLQGALVLEGLLFSRATPPAATLSPARGAPAFTYGSVERAAAFEAAAGTGLVLSGEAGAWVSLHDGADARWATLRLGEQPMQLRVPSDGRHVLVVHSGPPVGLAADRAPGDLALRELDVRAEAAPPVRVLPQGYAIERYEVPGPVFEVAHGDAAGAAGGAPGVGQCAEDGLVQLEQRGEVVGSSVEGEGAWSNATLRLAGGPVTVVHDGFGDLCPHPSILLWSYVR